MTDLGVDSGSLYQLAIDVSPSGIWSSTARLGRVRQPRSNAVGYARRAARAAARPPPPGRLWSAPGDTRTRLRGAAAWCRAAGKDGSLIPVEIGLSPLQTPAGVHTLASVVDVSERRRRERAYLEEFEDRRRSSRRGGKSARFMASRRIGSTRRSAPRSTTSARGLPSTAVRCFASVPLTGGSPWCPARPRACRRWTDRVAIERLPWTLGEVRAGRVVSFSSATQIPDTDVATYGALGTRSALVIPLAVDAHVVGAVAFETVQEERTWPAPLVHRLTVMAGVLARVEARRRREDALRRAIIEVERLKDEVHGENISLRREMRQRTASTAVVGKSAALCQVLDQVHQVGGHRIDRAAAGGDRRRQGTAGDADPRTGAAAGPSDGPRQLRRHPGRAD